MVGKHYLDRGEDEYYIKHVREMLKLGHIDVGPLASLLCLLDRLCLARYRYMSENWIFREYERRVLEKPIYRGRVRSWQRKKEAAGLVYPSFGGIDLA